MIPTAKGYFSGAGLMELGIQQAGVIIVQSLELDKTAIGVMQNNSHYFNHRIVHADMRDVLVKDQEETDIMVFTWPCKKYSTLADVNKARTGDELFLHAFRHVALELPEMFIVENVPGMKKFKVVMEAFTKIPNYYVNVICPVDAALWLPQKRQRLIIIATKKHFRVFAPSKANRIPTIKEIIEPDVDIRVNDSVIARINGMYRDLPIVVDPEDLNAIAPTCLANYNTDMGTRLVKDRKYEYGLRPFTIREYARLMGVPDDYIFPDFNFSYKLIGNGVAVPKARWIGEQAMKYFN